MRAVRQNRRVQDGRRGVVAVQVAVSMTTLLGFMALAVDVGAMYNTKAELQRTADAAAMAAAVELGDSSGDALANAREVAQQYANLNVVLNAPVGLDNSDLTFGQAYINTATNKYVFNATEVAPNAVRVRVRRTEGSPSGPMGLYFARVFGFNTANIAAQATAVLTPRDICFVLDLSLSHSFDSQLMHYKLTDVGPPMKNVWKHLWDTTQGAPPPDSGPMFGNMKLWGTDTVNAGWAYSSDTGLKQLKRGTAWTLNSTWASQSVVAAGYASYTTSQMNIINKAGGAGTETSTTNDTQKANYYRRVRVGLGLDRWRGDLNGNTLIDSSEVVPLVSYPSSSTNPSTKSKKLGGSWDEFIKYVADTSKADNITSDTGLSYRFLKYDPDSTCYGNPALRWRFGLKTMLDYVQQQEYAFSDSPGLSGSPQQPMKAVVDGVTTAIDFIKELDGDDQIGVVGYGQIGYGPMDKPSDLSWLTTDFDEVKTRVQRLQAAMWTGNTNISQGIDKATKVLEKTAPNSRSNAMKIIFLLTDGEANIVRAGNLSSSQNVPQAKLDTITAATDAQAAGYRIYTVSVGADADTEIMANVAQIGKGQTFTASGDIATYEQQLQDIFKELGGKRPVVLIE